LKLSCETCYWKNQCEGIDGDSSPCWAYYPAKLEDMAEFEEMVDLMKRDEESAYGCGIMIETEEE